MTSDLREQLKATLGSAYTLERELGGGGMSRVFVADETALGRKVVVKVLQPELAASVSTERFRREIQLAAQLQHPNIVPVLSAGIADGLPYYTMPFVEGESLRACLARGDALPISQVVRVLCDVASALSYSHEHGVVHRDIKPDNILLTKRDALVTDFGVAKALSASAERQRSAGALTTLGLALGTPAYMAPEQAAADPATDHRADIYALGAVAYEMLTGVPLFGHRSPSALLAAHITERPVPVEERRPGIPPALTALVMRCLEKNPDHRPQSADEVLSLLESVRTPSGDAAAPAAGAGFGRVSIRRVVAVYVVTLLGIVGVAKLATDQLGLPDWVLPGAILVMALILPVVALTALAHHGAHTPTSTTAASPGARAERPSGTRLAKVARPWLTWRRTIRAGALAIALFVALVAGYMVLRVLGIGPAGSLVAAGVMGERDRILVADFRVSGRDSLLGRAVTEALRTDLGQSRVVTMVQPSAIRGSLLRMERAPETPIDPQLAREIATREGIKAVVEGDVTAVGGGYVLTTRLVSPENGDVLAALRETAESERDIIRAIDRLSHKLRERIGESLKTIRATQPLDQVTTASLEALRKYTEGVRAMDVEGDMPKATALLEEAIRLDTTFAMAYRKLGVAYQRQGDQLTKQFAMFQKAFDYRDRLPDVERYLAEGSYYGLGPNFDLQKSLAAYEALLDIDPQHGPALNNAAILYEWLRDFPRAIEYFQRAIAADSGSSAYYGNLADAQLSAGRLDDAKATLALERTRFPANPGSHAQLAFLAAVEGDYDAARRQVTALREARPADLSIRSMTSNFLAGLAISRVQLAEGERLFRDAMAADRKRGIAGSQLEGEASLAFMDIWFRGDSAGGVTRMEAAMRATPLSELPPPERPYLQIADVYSLAGHPNRARALLAEFDRVNQGMHHPQKLISDRHVTLGAIALAERRYADAIAAFRAGDVGPCIACVLPPLGLAHDLAGNADSTIAVFERYLAKPSTGRVFVDPWFLAGIHKRLGELYDERNDPERAAEHYKHFIDLWNEADPELQSKVKAVRWRLMELRPVERVSTRTE